MLKFIYSEKATKFCKIFALLLSYVVPIKIKMKILFKDNFLQASISQAGCQNVGISVSYVSPKEYFWKFQCKFSWKNQFQKHKGIKGSLSCGK